ncbi:hypothetical protein B0T25DRAFT_446097 [Lasiosphaeria hispida]|uniref:Uncharacterized protein n=1 Tax=Lasiosphaeria hispida TaxID=260671 RepID=A0AAJ0MKV1_9PEZI|nr:hypothetical protein B0T25DRAFT_446097 [Lasiosphaeria hispida]
MSRSCFCFLPRSPTLHSAVVPALVLAGANLWNAHWDHGNHTPPPEERVEYPYQNIRTRNYPWGSVRRKSNYP